MPLREPILYWVPHTSLLFLCLDVCSALAITRISQSGSASIFFCAVAMDPLLLQQRCTALSTLLAHPGVDAASPSRSASSRSAPPPPQSLLTQVRTASTAQVQ